MKNLKLLYSSNIAATVSIAIITFTTIAAELLPGFKSYLKSISGHHWLSKSYGVIIIYLIVLAFLNFAIKEVSMESLRRSFMFTLAALVFGSLAIFLFFVWHFQ